MVIGETCYLGFCWIITDVMMSCWLGTLNKLRPLLIKKEVNLGQKNIYFQINIFKLYYLTLL